MSVVYSHAVHVIQYHYENPQYIRLRTTALKSTPAIKQWVLLTHSDTTECPYCSHRQWHIHIIAIFEKATARDEWVHGLDARNANDVKCIDGDDQVRAVLRMLHHCSITEAENPYLTAFAPAEWQWWQPVSHRGIALPPAETDPSGEKAGTGMTLDDFLAMSVSDTPIDSSRGMKGMVAEESALARLARAAREGGTQGRRSRGHDSFEL
ncbi:hypothetical protein [Prescottella subtropica]|uniref:hypothetical protein n=1 Tax=Prescottella subtropica TaxID=2545757 RepID=UPI0010F887B3|nr:hypothetical protein [Prescottella subtropica]